MNGVTELKKKTHLQKWDLEHEYTQRNRMKSHKCNVTSGILNKIPSLLTLYRFLLVNYLSPVKHIRCASSPEVIKYFKATHSTDPQRLAYNTQACSLISLSVSSRGTVTSGLSAAYTLFIRRLIKTKPSLPSFHQARQSAPLNHSLFEAIRGNTE